MTLVLNPRWCARGHADLPDLPPGGRVSELGEWVQAACGCVWRESRPTGCRIDPAEPRACVTHSADHPASLYPSPQGMAMVPVTYHRHRPDEYRCICDPNDLFDPPRPTPRAVDGCPAHRARRAAQQLAERHTGSATP